MQLGFTHGGERFTATRALNVTKSGEEEWRGAGRSEFSLDSGRADGQTRRVSNPTGRVESILPANVRNYFFFDGEKIEQFTRPDNEKEVKEAVRNVLKIEVLERARTHLDVAAREYQSSLKNLASGGLEQLLDDEENIRLKSEKTRKELAELREEKAAAERQTKEIDARLSEIHEVREWDNRRKVASETMKVRQEELDQLWRSIRDTSNVGYYRFAGEAIDKATSIVDAMRERGEIPPGIREQFVQDLLANHMCICGRPIEEESEEHRPTDGGPNENTSFRLGECTLGSRRRVAGCKAENPGRNTATN